MTVSVGSVVSVKTRDRSHFSGTVFSSDDKFLVLHNTDYVTGKSQVCILPASNVDSITATSSDADLNFPAGGLMQNKSQHVSYVKSDAWNALSSLDYELPAAPEPKRAQQLLLGSTEARMKRLGNGVSAEAQLIFDFVSKTLECKWDGDSILVMDEVRVRPPYTPESATAADNGPLADRVSRMVKLARQKLGLNSAS
eukprot:ANDGO_03275.mRNA.1 Protein LSM12